jgi:S1-C subfamily serine protease
MKGYTFLALWVSLIFTPVCLTAQEDEQEDRPGYLGIVPRSLTRWIKQGLGYKGRGVLVEEVIPDTPADECGLEEDDIIAKVDDERVKDVEDLVDIIMDYEPGTKVTLRVWRYDDEDKKGEWKDIEVKLAARPEPEEWEHEWEREE